LRQLALLYNHKDDDSQQFTRWQMLVAMDHGRRIQAKAALCEALSTTPSEESMEQWHIPEEPTSTPKPEPTEDHLRRAYDLLPWNGEDEARRIIARLLAERDALEAENSLLAAGCCINPGQHGLVGDEHGNFQCTAYEALSAEEKAHSEALARIAELEAERDAMQAEIASLRDYITEPTPDPDLVLAREAVAGNFDGQALADELRAGRYDLTSEVQSALRALELAKEQAHDQ
jgi:hypothetical protein